MLITLLFARPCWPDTCLFGRGCTSRSFLFLLPHYYNEQQLSQEKFVALTAGMSSSCATLGVNAPVMTLSCIGLEIRRKTLRVLVYAFSIAGRYSS